ncbi:MAG: cation-translocating P-type ATPase, partial [Promethearchaeota archaeon]
MEEKLNYHTMDINSTLNNLKSTENGISEEEAKSRLEKYGTNEIEEKGRRTIFQMFIDQFKDFLIILLIIAAAISLIIYFIESSHGGESSEIVDAIVIFAIIFANAFIGLYQEHSSEKSLEALKKLAAPKAKVVRQGPPREIMTPELVPGDVVILETGDRIPADLRLIEAVNLKIQEAAFTGESVPVKKKIDVIDEKDIPINERKNMAYSTTVVTYGRGRGLVIHTGMSTEYGKIAKTILTAEEKKTPLQEKLAKLGKKLGILIIIICVVIFITAYVRSILTHHHFDALDMFLAAVGLAVAAVPEGLPAIVTIALSIGVMRLVEKNAIIRKLPAVETLGCSTIICSDKTGTLTQNEMTVRKVLVNNKVIDITGAGYEPIGKFYAGSEEILPEKDDTLSLLLRVATLCNDASLHRNTTMGSRWEIIGDPTEGALLTLSAKASNDFLKEELELTFPRIAEVPFDSKRKAMSTIHSVNGKIYAYIKGAPEQIVKKSIKISLNGQIIDFDQENKQKVLGINNEMASEALRVLGYAYKEVEKKEEYDENIESDLIFLGLSGMIDPPRQEVKEALVKVKRAGMDAKMITGDNPQTAVAIAKELKLTRGEIKAVTGTELNKMDDRELEDKVEDISVFARTSPEHKVRICQALKKRGHVVAMTGDGINDAPALKIADIGVAMGITGTDVTQEASDMILTDDNFATIVNAIEQGRDIYGNIRKFIFYLLSSNTGEILTMFFGIIIGFQLSTIFGTNFILPLTAITILWINLVTDGLPATAL